jgi:hypothetical protein
LLGVHEYEVAVGLVAVSLVVEALAFAVAFAFSAAGSALTVLIFFAAGAEVAEENETFPLAPTARLRLMLILVPG